MKTIIHRRLHNWHAYTGLSVTVLLVALCLTALPALFIKDINQWLTPTETITPFNNIQTLDNWLAQAESQLTLEEDMHVRFHYTDQPIQLWQPVEGKFAALVQNKDGQFVQSHTEASMRILAGVHHNFLLPSPIGEYLVGLIGLAMLALVFMGVLIHTKWKKEKTVLRTQKSNRVWLSDLHKILGFWLLPFHIFVSYTGATLGLANLLLVVAALSAFNGDKDAAVEAVLGKEPEMSGEQCAMISPVQLAQQATDHWQQKYGDSQIKDVEIHGWKDCNGQITIASSIPGYLLSSNAVTYSLTTGELKNEIDWIPAGFGERWYALLGPLHFGTYAGYVSLWLFFISAVLLTVMVVAGVLLWLMKKKAHAEKSWFIKTLTGTTLGISSATIALLLIAKVQNLTLTNPGYDVVFYKLVYAISFAVPFFISTFYLKSWKVIATLIGLMYLMAPIISWVFFDFRGDTLAVDASLLITAAVFLTAPYWPFFNKSLSDKKQRKERKEIIEEVKEVKTA